MGKNYTKPHNKDYEDKPEDYLFLTMAFSQALATVLKDGKGILIELKGDALKIHPEAKRVIVFNDGDMMRIIDATERKDLRDGDFIKMIKPENLEN